MGNLRLITDSPLVNRPDDLKRVNQKLRDVGNEVGRYGKTYQSETDEKVPSIGVPTRSAIIPFTQDEVDSLSAGRGLLDR